MTPAWMTLGANFDDDALEELGDDLATAKCRRRAPRIDEESVILEVDKEPIYDE